MTPSPDNIAADLTPQLTLLRAMREHGYRSAAAEAAGVPQPTATRWIAGLGEIVGMPLIRRHGRRSELTDAGAALADAALAAHQALAAGVARALEAADPEHGQQVVFGFLRSLGTGCVPELLRAFRARHPSVGITLVEAGHDALVERVRAGTIDVALSSPLDAAQDLDLVELFAEPLVLVVPGDHRLAHRRRVRLAECRNEVFVGLHPGIGLRRAVETLFAAADLDPVHSFEGDDVATVRGLVAAGLGLGVLPAHERGPRAGTSEVQLSPPADRRLGLITSAERPLEPAASSFHRHAVAHRFSTEGPR